MKSFLKTSVVVLALGSSAAMAANPINGWYAGIILGGTYAPKAQLTFPAPITPNSSSCSRNATCATTTATLNYSGYGNIGGQIGVRHDNLRVELEPVVNYNPYKKLTVGTIEYTSPKSSTALRIAGNTTTVGLFLNGFYDFYTPHSESNFAPYLGAGIGYAYIDNENRFYCNNQTIQCTVFSTSTRSAAVQGIIGAAYFMDDFTWFGLDYRYITTRKIDLLNTRIQLHTINLSFTGMFYCG